MIGISALFMSNICALAPEEENITDMCAVHRGYVKGKKARAAMTSSACCVIS